MIFEKPFSVPGLAFFEAVIKPSFADITPAGFPQSTLSEWSLMDDVPAKRPIIDIGRVQNIMQRRDASCDIIYKKVFGAVIRYITTDELYAATQLCRNEFYQGALKDWRERDPLFGTKILPYFQQAVNTDIITNAYFGDVDRVALPTAAFSTDKFDGIFKWIKNYITAGVIPAGQTVAIANGTDYNAVGGPAAAYALLKELYDSQPVLMNSFTDSEKAFYVSKEIASAYQDYLAATAATGGGFIDLLVNGNAKRNLSFKSIPIFVEETWTPVITQIKGATGYAAILTIRKNFIFATDKSYGEGVDGHSALEIFYDVKDMTMYWRNFLKAGTQIGLPEYLVIALSSWT